MNAAGLSRNGAEIEVAVGSKGIASKGSAAQIPAEKLSDEEREKYLLEWTTARCGDDGVSFTFDEGWDMIKRFGLDVLNEMMKQFLSKDDLNNRKERKPLGKRCWSSLYTTSYQMVNISSTSGELFYDKICTFIFQYVTSSTVQETVVEADLCEFITVWQSYKIMTKWIWHLFMHLETSVIKLNDLLTFTAVALVNFHEHVYKRHHKSLTSLALGCILREREGEDVDRSLLQEALQIYLTMGLASKIDSAFATERREGLRNLDAALKLQEFRHLYLQDFEAAFLQETKAFYARKSSEWIATMDAPSFVTRIHEAMCAEESRCVAYLNPVTKPKLQRVVLEECIVAHSDAIFDAAKDMMRAIYDNTQLEGYVVPREKALVVERLYRFCTQCQALESCKPAYALATRLCASFQSYVVELGLKVVEDRRAEVTRLAEESKVNKTVTDANVADPHTIGSILRLFHYIPQIVQSVLGDDQAFKQASGDAFTTVVNADMGKFSVMQMLAAYCDNILKGNMKVTETEADSMLTNCMAVFAHLIDKDMFADLHRSYLAKRLLSKRSISDDAEKLLVGLMKMQCGAQFTSKLEGMLHDYHSATSTQVEYDGVLRQWQGAQAREVRQIAFTNTLLTSSYWPTQKTRAYILPPEMRALQGHFAEWYKAKNSNRTLQWVCTLGDVSVSMVMAGRDYELTVAVLQAVVLRCFHRQAAALSFEQIKAASGIEEEEVLKRVLHSLACQKFKILVKQSEAKSLTQDSYKSNAAFTNKLKKFRVPMASIDESDQAAPSRGMQEERSSTVDASIVRIMKARKILSHSDLQYEVLRQVSGFQPDVRFIKQRIESLIERDYLERDATDARCYKYLP